jgi:serine/threonine protein kinase
MSMSRSFPCKRCGEPVSVTDEALRDPTVTLVCNGCGQRYARRASPSGAGATVSPTASKFTSRGSDSSSGLGERPAPVRAPRSSIGATRSLDVLDTEGSPSIFVGGDFVSNRYRIVRFIARGGMGEVYEAEDIELRGRVALKTIRPAAAGESWAVERFKREIHLARQVTHPNVCRIFDVGFHEVSASDSVVFLTM